MMGAIHSGDVVEVEPVRVGQLWRGDVVVYERFGRVLAHRLIGILDSRLDDVRLIVRGDNQSVSDPPVPSSAVLGRVTRVERNLPQLLRALGRSVYGCLNFARTGGPERTHGAG